MRNQTLSLPSQIWDTVMDPCLNWMDVVYSLYFFTKLKWLDSYDVDRSIISGGTWRNESSMPLCASRTQVSIALLKSFRYENSYLHPRWCLALEGVQPANFKGLAPGGFFFFFFLRGLSLE
jgi:hypothetical protein